MDEPDNQPKNQPKNQQENQRVTPRRCSIHGSQSAAASCADCGRGLCIRCAVLVRGDAYGTECLERTLGPTHLIDPGPPPRVGPPRLLAGIGFLVAVIATALPWKRFGLGAGPFGAYGVVPRWSWVAAAASVIGLAIWAIVALRPRKQGAMWRGWLLGAAFLTTVGAAMSALAPRGFGPLGFGPLVALLGGILALAGAWPRASESATDPAAAEAAAATAAVARDSDSP